MKSCEREAILLVCKTLCTALCMTAKALPCRWLRGCHVLSLCLGEDKLNMGLV